MRTDVVCVPVGSSDELEYVTDRSAACQSATDTLPTIDSAPEVALNAAVTPLPVTGYASTSPRRMPVLIVTVALSRFGSVKWSMSMIVMFSLTTVSFPFSMYTRLSASTSDSTGTSFTGVTVTVRVTALLVKSPSLITNDTVRTDVVCVPVGSSDELEYVTDRSAVCH